MRYAVCVLNLNFNTVYFQDIDDDLYFILQDHLDSSLDNLKEEKAAR